jgi:hypothetical protein
VKDTTNMVSSNDDQTPRQMDRELSRNRRASTPISEGDRPELLGEAGASPPLWAFSFSGAGASQGSALARNGPGPLTRARSRREGPEPVPATELRLQRPSVARPARWESDEPSIPMLEPVDRGDSPISPRLSARRRDLETTDAARGVSPPATQACRGAETRRLTPVAASQDTRWDPIMPQMDHGPPEASIDAMNTSRGDPVPATCAGCGALASHGVSRSQQESQCLVFHHPKG